MTDFVFMNVYAEVRFVMALLDRSKASLEVSISIVSIGLSIITSAVYK